MDLIDLFLEEIPWTKIDLEPSALNLALFSSPIKTRITGSLAAITFNGEMKNIAIKIIAHPDFLVGDALTIKLDLGTNFAYKKEDPPVVKAMNVTMS